MYEENKTVPFSVQMAEWCGCTMVKIFEDMFIHFDRKHQRDTQTDRQTGAGRHRAHTYAQHRLATMASQPRQESIPPGFAHHKMK